MTTESIPVRTLLGAKGFDESLICLKSLADYSADPIRLVFHDDGSLNDGHRDRLASLTPGAEFVDRRTSNEAVNGMLSKFPNCLSARNSGPLFLKLFDVALLNSGRLMYADSDVLFLRRYSGLFKDDSTSRPTFMTDVTHAYAVRPWRVWPLGRLRLAGRVNTGLIAGWSCGLDLELIEWVLSRLKFDAAFARRSYWAEQTCWAALAARSEFDLLNPIQVILASATMRDYQSDVIAIHFVSTFRNRLTDFVARGRSLGEPAVPISVRPGRLVSATGLFKADLLRKRSTASG